MLVLRVSNQHNSDILCMCALDCGMNAKKQNIFTNRDVSIDAISFICQHVRVCLRAFLLIAAAPGRALSSVTRLYLCCVWRVTVQFARLTW
jgi:hypothetical protein